MVLACFSYASPFSSRSILPQHFVFGNLYGSLGGPAPQQTPWGLDLDGFKIPGDFLPLDP